MRLPETQRWFAGAVMNDAELERTDELLTRGPRLDAAGRLHVYRHGYVARLVECLADDYPVLEHALGQQAFEALCRTYIARYPSTAPNLNAYGARLPSVCEGFAADLARLEWAMVEVIHEPASPPVTMNALAAVPPESWGAVRLVPSKALRLLAFDHPANDYYQAFRDDRSPALPAPSPSATVVYRSGHTVWRMGLTPP
ncbi:MAG TPA: DNA-binding domain-containing protein, partial [Polyangiaceae bacterium]